MNTYANQKVVSIQKNKYTSDFLQIGNNEWQQAARDLSSSAFILYLYLASNSDGFIIALSQKAVQEATGLSKASYHRAVDELLDKGYMCCDHGNHYMFATTPNSDWLNDL